MVAEQLRRRILASELPDGSMLPRQEDLLAEFGVSVTSLREAMRILETEGFVTMVRGSLGGAVVHVPQPSDAAYTFALVLESRAAQLDDVMKAMQWLEPACAAALARRRDRRRSVVPRLRALLAESADLLGDPQAYGESTRLFHTEMVAGCDNQTMILMVGALESLFTAQVRALRQDGEAGIIPDRTVRRRTLGEHEEIVEAIERGDADAAESAARAHFSHRKLQRVYAGQGVPVRASLLRDA